MKHAGRAAQHAHHPATLGLPVSYEYPLGGIIGRSAIGFVLLACGGAALVHAGVLWMIGAIILLPLGGVVAVSNLRALIDPKWRKLVLDEDGVEVRYGFTRRRYPFLDYSDYRISRVGLRRFLTALPVEIDRSLGERARRVRVTLYDRPALLAPMPMMGGGAPATLLEWQSTLNELRRAALATIGLTAEFDHGAADDRAPVGGAALWRAKEQAGARPSRLSRAGYVRGRAILALAFFVVLLVPLGFSCAVQLGAVTVCSSASGAACLSIGPGMQQVVMIGGPVLAIVIFMLGHARLAMRRAHDLDEDLSFWKAALGPFTRSGMLRQRLSRQEGSSGTNRFGPAPSN